VVRVLLQIALNKIPQTFWSFEPDAKAGLNRKPGKDYQNLFPPEKLLKISPKVLSQVLRGNILKNRNHFERGPKAPLEQRSSNHQF
jgi:hypothetical protein